ncbi:tRNA (uridine(34)/cytosine(34)/5-carboxymethylaminomethyluridine(34)-2'-O)-methyltransferase TrmL [Ectothiorhodospira shaposhnikovii]|uniref:tRNA (cytidine(34)-2'-O)-methyltransferase n=1 Tax=Ectothiorhodospira shaposhnikovii TaxID=1054 RepID=UPI001902D55A|nr:tRNA (cytidine(34)-2'-O)-methyltransferase [Ectothiorhodospira shaposhnikovii]MBK1672873.1 tRNA (uridine(34)/cytosine(34)/5-carboxymethylaminomethyluridine(34)-2'-O)-methyltransferase TrmL [Ectothiorhodospira shaposhnikovii]
MFHIVLYQPEIPPNTGNVMRLAANTGCRLHLIHPLGFTLDDARLRRAGLDYRDLTSVTEYDSLSAFSEAVHPRRVFALSTRGSRIYSEVMFQPGDAFLFGPETRGLPDAVLGSLPGEERLRIPMVTGSRSLNLSNSVAVVVMEAWRQLGYPGAAT